MWIRKSVVLNGSLSFSTIHNAYYYHYRLLLKDQEAEEEQLCVSEPNVMISPTS
jgi:hypothetical protein